MNAILKAVPSYIPSNMSDEEMHAMLRDSTLPPYIAERFAALIDDAAGARVEAESIDERAQGEASAKCRADREVADAVSNLVELWEVCHKDGNSILAAFMGTEEAKAVDKAIANLEEVAPE